MNQILVTEKLYITPELKRKKKMYKINFILSLVTIIVLCSFYIHSEYARNKDEELSEDLLSGMLQDESQMTQEEIQISNMEDDGVWRVMIKSAEELQQQSQQQNNQTTKTNQTQNNEQNPFIASKKKITKKVATYVTASNGKRYPSIGRIQIPKIGVDYAVLSETSVEWLRISPCKFWGPDMNEIGNFSIAGHNYRNKKFFSKVPTLNIGDKIKLTDLSNRTITYRIFDKYQVSPKDTSCIENIEGKENKRIVTLITCTNDSKKRVIIHAEEI